MKLSEGIYIYICIYTYTYHGNVVFWEAVQLSDHFRLWCLGLYGWLVYIGTKDMISS